MLDMEDNKNNIYNGMTGEMDVLGISLFTS